MWLYLLDLRLLQCTSWCPYLNKAVISVGMGQMSLLLPLTLCRQRPSNTRDGILNDAGVISATLNKQCSSFRMSSICRSSQKQACIII